MMAQSIAEKYRKHREVMELALELRITPKEAEAIIAQRAARARWEESNQRLAARMQTLGGSQGDAVRADPWWRQGNMA